MIAGLVLAAGAGTRFGQPKQLAELDGRPLLEHSIRAIAAAPVDRVVVVLGAGADQVTARVDPHGAVFPRSANKPMQATAMVRSGLSRPDPADLALVAASHFGEPFHIERVRGLLRAASLDESALLCPPDLPLSADARADVAEPSVRDRTTAVAEDVLSTAKSLFHAVLPK